MPDGLKNLRLRNPSTAALTTGFVLALLELAPILGRGYVLLRDMVFVPKPPLDVRLLGVTGVPRSTPSDLIVALLSHVIPGDAVEDLILFLIIAIGAWGAGRLVGDSTSGAVAAAALYAWNPYLCERLLLGQWAILLGYAALPWIAAAAIDARDESRRPQARIFFWLALAAAGGVSSEVLAAFVLIPISLSSGVIGRLQRTTISLTMLIFLALPWLLPAVTSPIAAPPDRIGSALFAARPDTPLGSVGSLLTLGGVWNSDAVPSGRDNLLVALAALLLTVAAIWGIALRRRTRATAGLIAAGALGLALALWGVIPGLRNALHFLTEHSQTFDLLRDGQRSLAPFVLLIAVGWGTAVAEAARHKQRAVALTAVPLLLLPASAWGIDGALSATNWPNSWQETATNPALSAGPLIILPWSQTRTYPWNSNNPTADPAGQWFRQRVISDLSLRVGNQQTADEDPLAARVAKLAGGNLSLTKTLAKQGIPDVLVETNQPGGQRVAARLSGSTLVLSRPGLDLYRIPGVSPEQAPISPLWVALLADTLVGFALIAAGICCGVVATFRRL